MSKQFPECPQKGDACVFVESDVASTCVYFPPRYNRAGVNLNPDRNRSSWTVICEVCGNQWEASKIGDDDPVFQLLNEDQP